MFDFAEARLQVHGSNVSVLVEDGRTQGSTDETENNDIENVQKNEEISRKGKDSREILYRLGSILWEIILVRIMVFRIFET